jgi:hypothetical protein
MADKTSNEEPLQVYETKELAERQLSRYAELCKDWGISQAYRVKVAPMQRRRTKGTWGVWLVKHRQGS